MVILVLALIWAAVLLPPLVRSRLEGNPVDSVGRFRRHLRVIESTSPAASSLASTSVLAGPSWAHSTQVMPKTWIDEARRLRGLRRRREIATMILGAMATTLLVGLIPAFRFVLVFHVIADLLFAGYIFLLVQARNLEAERQMNAHFAALKEQTVVDQEVGYSYDTLQQQAF